MTHWSFGETYYVKLRQFIPGSGERPWLGWLAHDPAWKQYATWTGGENDPPSENVLRVQWAFDADRGGATDQAGYETLLASGPRYLRALTYPGSTGPLFLGGKGSDGFYCYWHPGDPPGPGGNYALTVDAMPGTNEALISRFDGAEIRTYGDRYMAYDKSRNGSRITFEFIPTARFGIKHENWMAQQNAAIGNRPLPDIVIPGSHDAGASQITRAGGNMTSRTQGLSIYDQLMAGSRYLDLRVWRAADGVWYMHHGKDWTDIRLDDVVEQIHAFLAQHPGEVLLASLLPEDTKGRAGFTGHLLEAWELVLGRLHGFHLNQFDEQGNSQNIMTLTPNILRGLGKNFLLFGWGDTESWKFTPAGGSAVFVAPWGSRAEGAGPRAVMDLDGVYVDDGLATPNDIRLQYEQYAGSGGLWILHTNTPWQLASWDDSLYAKHERNAWQFARYFDVGTMDRWKANIVNIDYVGDSVVGADGLTYDLVTSVINSNLR
jgi:hypothetical protein